MARITGDHAPSLANIADQLLGELWHRLPENMFLIRVVGPGDFVLDAANPTERALLGEDCEGRGIETIVPTETANRVIARYRHCIDSGEAMEYEESVSYFDNNGVWHEGTWLTLLVPLHEGGPITRLFGVSRDVTTLRATTDALRRHKRELETRIAERTGAIEKANEELRALNAQLDIQASRDSLTGVFNRRYTEEQITRELNRAARLEHSLCLLLFDLDRFKAVNDNHGHAAGDALLKRLATAIAGELRAVDLLGRYGGDEFVVVLPETVADEARIVAQRLRDTAKTAAGITISLGLVEYTHGAVSAEALLAQADHGLLAAKRAGRDRLGSV